MSYDLVELPMSGGQLRATRLLSSLAEHAEVHAVTLARFAEPAAIQLATGAASVRHVPPCASPVRKRLLALRHGLPLTAAALSGPRAQAAVRSLSRPGDVLLVDELWPAALLRGAARTVLSLQNADVELLRHLPQPARPVRRLERAWDVAMFARLERRVARETDLVICVSEEDRALVRPARAAIVPNGTDLPSHVTAVPAAGTLLFIGSLDYPPNADAVRWWRTEVAPLLPADLPPLSVVGRNADTVLADLTDDPMLRIHANVPDVTPYLTAARVVVVPLRYGGGTRLKVLEAMAHARPVVSTSKGAEGLPVVDGKQLLLRDGAAALAAAVAELYRDRAAAQRLADAGRQLAQGYSWDAIGARFVAAVRAVAV